MTFASSDTQMHALVGFAGVSALLCASCSPNVMGEYDGKVVISGKPEVPAHVSIVKGDGHAMGPDIKQDYQLTMTSTALTSCEIRGVKSASKGLILLFIPQGKCIFADGTAFGDTSPGSTAGSGSTTNGKLDFNFAAPAGASGSQTTLSFAGMRH